MYHFLKVLTLAFVARLQQGREELPRAMVTPPPILEDSEDDLTPEERGNDSTSYRYSQIDKKIFTLTLLIFNYYITIYFPLT